jgi:3-isopropylmalate/(R)-2-methylmalate dehydratase small subunit
MQPFRALRAIAMPLGIADLNTDRIFPSRFMRKPRTAAYADCCFHDLRFAADGTADPATPFADPRYEHAEILVAGANFGQGSSREGAVYALQEYGFRVVIAPNFGEIFAANALINGLLTIVLDEARIEALLSALRAANLPEMNVDLEAREISGGGLSFRFDIAPSARKRLLDGLDDIALSLAYEAEISAFEARRGDLPS